MVRLPNGGVPFNEVTVALQDDILTGGTATGVCGGVEGAAPEVPVGVEWVEPGTCGGVGVIRPGACDGVDVVEPGACDVVEGVEPGVGCGVVGGAGDVLLEGEVFNGYWFSSVFLKHKVSSCKPYCFLNHNAFCALIERDSNLSCACRLESVVISLVNICLSSTSSLCSFSNFLIYFCHVSSSKTFYFSSSRFSYFVLHSSTSA